MYYKNYGILRVANFCKAIERSYYCATNAMELKRDYAKW